MSYETNYGFAKKVSSLVSLITSIVSNHSFVVKTTCTRLVNEISEVGRVLSQPQ